MLQFQGLPPLDEWREPPRPSISPLAHRGGMVPAFNTNSGAPSEVNLTFGQNITRVVRFVSTESLGFLTWTEVQALMTLYDNGERFNVATDLLLPLGESARSYQCRFEEPPVFTLVNAQRRLYYMDLLLRMEL